MAEAQFGFAAGKRDVDIIVRQLDYAEGHSHEIQFELALERFTQFLRGHPETLDIKILGLGAEQHIAHAPAHKQRAATGRTHDLGNFRDHSLIRTASMAVAFLVARSKSISAPSKTQGPSATSKREGIPVTNFRVTGVRSRPMELM